jgi:hypothetical protein
MESARESAERRRYIMRWSTLTGGASRVLADGAGIAGRLVVAGTGRYILANANASRWVNMMRILDLRV